MTEAMYYVLLTLMYPNHGYQLMQEIRDALDAGAFAQMRARFKADRARGV